MNTIDESVWDTLRRDLLAVWEKMRQVLWPKYLLGGMLSEGGGMGSVRELGSVQGMRNLIGRWPDAETVLQGGMSEGLRDWDLWYVLGMAGRSTMPLSTLLTCFSQGSIALLFDPFYSVVPNCPDGTALLRLQRRLCDYLDCRGCCHPADQAAWWKHVRSRAPSEIARSFTNVWYSSFFQSVCIIGYTLFPLCIASLLSAIGIPMIVRIPVYIVLGLWSLAAGVSILGGSGVVKGRVALAVYPLFIFYVGLDCLCLIS